MPKLGYNLLTWGTRLSDDTWPILERLRRIGYDGIEYLDAMDDPVMYRRLGGKLRELEMQTTCVLALGPDANPISPDPAVRRKAIERIRSTVDRAVESGAKLICGPFHSAFATFTRNPPTDDEYQRSADVLREAGDYAAQADVVLALEALNRFECYLCNTMAQLRRLMETVNHPRVRAMLDTHHAHIEEKSQTAAIQEIAPWLVHVHVSENDRGTPGDGQVHWEKALRALASIGYDGWLTVEAFTRLDTEFAGAIHVWREFSPPWDIAEKGYHFLRGKIAATGFA